MRHGGPRPLPQDGRNRPSLVAVYQRHGPRAPWLRAGPRLRRDLALGRLHLRVPHRRLDVYQPRPPRLLPQPPVLSRVLIFASLGEIAPAMNDPTPKMG